MKRRGFFALLAAPFVARLLPAAPSKGIIERCFDWHPQSHAYALAVADRMPVPDRLDVIFGSAYPAPGCVAAEDTLANVLLTGVHDQALAGD